MKSTAAPFFAPPLAPSRSLPEWGKTSQLALHCRLIQQLGALSKMVKKARQSSPWSPCTFSIILLYLLLKLFGHPPGQLLWEQKIPVKSGVNNFSWHVMELSEFHGTLSPVILNCGDNFSDIVDWSDCGEISLIRRNQFLLLHLLIIPYSCILVMAL